MFTALLDRVNQGDKPAPQKVQAFCEGFEAAYNKGRRIQPGYRSPSLTTRVTPR